MRRLFIIRKDLHLSAGKLAAMVGHCCEAYWTNLLKNSYGSDVMSESGSIDEVKMSVRIPIDIWKDYVRGIFKKTICEAKNLNHLKKILDLVAEHNRTWMHDQWEENRDYGFINDNCLTELTPENKDGTTTVGIWFKPLDDEVSHWLSKKYQLYKG